VNQQGTRRRLEHTPADDGDDESSIPIEISQTTQIRLGDQEQIMDYYQSIFKGIQQLALKAILKEWIKEIEPKKQKNFPYKKGHDDLEFRPAWWPKEAKYKEPDHIKVEGQFSLGTQIISPLTRHRSCYFSYWHYSSCPGSG
jgi:hypothetical protein